MSARAGRWADSPSFRSRRASGALTYRSSARPNAVIRCFHRDLYVVRVRLAKTRAADADEARFAAEILDRRRAHVAHAKPKTANELIHERRERTARRDATLDPFGHELAELGDVLLSVAVARTLSNLHRAERSH